MFISTYKTYIHNVHTNKQINKFKYYIVEKDFQGKHTQACEKDFSENPFDFDKLNLTKQLKQTSCPNRLPQRQPARSNLSRWCVARKSSSCCGLLLCLNPYSYTYKYACIPECISAPK